MMASIPRDSRTDLAQPTDQPHINPDQRLTVKQLAALLGIGVSTTWKMVADRRLPTPERYGKRCSRWRYGDVLNALNKQAKGGTP